MCRRYNAVLAIASLSQSLRDKMSQAAVRRVICAPDLTAECFSAWPDRELATRKNNKN